MFYTKDEKNIDINKQTFIFLAEDYAQVLIDNFNKYPNNKYNYNNFIDSMTFNFKKPYFEESWDSGKRSFYRDGEVIEPAEKEPAFDLLNDLILQHYSAIHFLQYEKLKTFVLYDERGMSDYYSNGVEAVKRLYWDDFSQFLTHYKLEKTTEMLNTQERTEYINNTYTKEWFEQNFIKSIVQSKAKKK